MLCTQRRSIAENLTKQFLSEEVGFSTPQSINQGGCGEYVHFLNEAFKANSLEEHEGLCTLDFLAEGADSFYCEHVKKWSSESVTRLGATLEEFEEFRRQVELVDSRCFVGYHVWLFDGTHHYDAECLDGVKNPLELPFFKRFTEPEVEIV